MEATGGDVLPYTPENLISNIFLGEGVQVTNIEYSGNANAVGYFDNGAQAIGIDRGILLTTGVAAKVVGNGEDGAQDNNDLNGTNIVEADLEKIANGEPLRNVAKYTITFVPSSDTLQFRYVFASEEYPQFVCSEFNDVFGFFISGPGINGGFENDGKNIALIPGTNFPVAINFVNNGQMGVWGSGAYCDGTNGSLNFDNFFNDNQNSPTQPVYDGYTKVFTAEAVVVPCQEYTIKLAIADVTDEGYDSGVFLEAKSFGTRELSITSDTYNPDGAITEGCTEGYVNFNLTKPSATDYVINYNLFGTATNGDDYERLPGQLIIPAGQTSGRITIKALEDNIIEAVENVLIEIQKDMCSKDTVEVYIKDNLLSPPQLTPATICKGETVNLDGELTNLSPVASSFESTRLVAITPYNTTVSSDLTVNNIFPPTLKEGLIESVCIDIQHNNPEDIDAYLVAPNGNFILLTSDNGAGGSNYTQTCFTPDALNPISSPSVSAPFTGDYLPEGIWSDLYANDSPTNGVWKLMLRDDELGSTGVLNSWSISFRQSMEYRYTWSGTDNLSCTDCATTNVTPQGDATYEVEVMDAYGCLVNEDVAVEVLDVTPAPTVTCIDRTGSSVQFGWNNPGNINYLEYRIDGATWEQLDASETDFNVENLAPGTTVTFEIRGVESCPGEVGRATCMAENCTPPTINLTETKTIKCFGETTGAVQLTASGQANTYEFTLDGETNQTGVFENLAAGDFTAVIEDENGCITNYPFTISQPDELELAAQAERHITCFGNLDGVAIADAFGGTAPYTFKWENGFDESRISQLGAGTISVTVTDNNGCKANTSVELLQPDALTARLDVQHVSCSGTADGNAQLFVENGTAPYRYEWADGSTSTSVENLSGGMVQVKVIDANGCELDLQEMINENPPIEVTVSTEMPSCFDGDNGRATITATGGSGTFEFNWEHGVNGSDLNDLTPGAYKISVVDSEGCIVVRDVQIDNQPEIRVDIATAPTSCFNTEDGEATIQVSGGMPSYKVSWEDGNTDLVREDLAGGEYMITVTDGNNCQFDTPLKIDAPEEIMIDFEVENAKCFGENGSIKVNGAGGVGALNFDLGQGFGGDQFTEQPAGIYAFRVMDINNCMVEAEAEITQPDSISSFEEITHVTCFGRRDGKIKTQLNGGVGNYSLSWNSQVGNFDNETVLEFLPAGSYEVNALDGNGCVFNKTIEVNEPELLEAIAEPFPITCSGRKDGEILIEPTGGTAPYEFFLNGESRGDREQISNLHEGNYYITIKDLNDCIFESDVLVVDEVAPIELDLGQDTLVEYGATVQISPKIESTFPITDFVWESTHLDMLSCTDCLDPQATPKAQSSVKLTITDEKGCRTEDILNLFIEKDFQVLVPTGFSPNQDGANDLLLVHGKEGTIVKEMKIFDRWGELLYVSEEFEINDPYTGWDGLFRGKTMDPGVYVWYLEVEFEDGSSDSLKGETTLIR